MAERKKILLVEDEQDLVDLVKMRLDAAGYAVTVVTDGAKTLESVHAEKPDLIILDVMIPKIDGFKICRMLKFDRKYKDIPIIIFTVRAMDSDRALAEEVGADAYITKPFVAEVLLAKMKELLGEI